MAYRSGNRVATAMIGAELLIFEKGWGVIFEFRSRLTKPWLVCHRIQHDVDAESISIGRELIEKSGILALAFP